MTTLIKHNFIEITQSSPLNQIPFSKSPKTAESDVIFARATATER